MTCTYYRTIFAELKSNTVIALLMHLLIFNWWQKMDQLLVIESMLSYIFVYSINFCDFFSQTVLYS